MRSMTAMKRVLSCYIQWSHVEAHAWHVGWVRRKTLQRQRTRNHERRPKIVFVSLSCDFCFWMPKTCKITQTKMFVCYNRAGWTWHLLPRILKSDWGIMGNIVQTNENKNLLILFSTQVEIYEKIFSLLWPQDCPLGGGGLHIYI